MNTLIALWLPILLSAVVVFIISSLVHMLLKWHASDYGTVANEDAIRAAIRAGNPAPGRYVIPHCGDMKDMASEAMVKKYTEGPVMHFTILPNGAPNMGKYLGLWFAWAVVVSTIAAFVAAHIVPAGHAHALTVAKLVGAITLISHGFGTVQESIWVGRPWSSSVKYLLDAVFYAFGAGAVFYWLWP